MHFEKFIFLQMSRDMRFTTIWYVRLAKVQTSLRKLYSRIPSFWHQRLAFLTMFKCIKRSILLLRIAKTLHNIDIIYYLEDTN